jgi:hypothetical protein
MKTTTQEIFMNNSTYRGFTDFEWIAIDNALEALLTELEEMADPEFSVALENVVYAYDLDEHQYDDLCNTQYSDFL